MIEEVPSPVNVEEAENPGAFQRPYCPGCGTWVRPGAPNDDHETVMLPARIWIYTNYDCNFSCSYCLAQSSPKAARRALEPETFRQVVDEAHEMGFAEMYFTGGEPMLLPELPAMLAYASARFPTVVLSNASLAHGTRLARLREVANDAMAIQVSLDGATAGANDAYRGDGTWKRTLSGIRNLIEAGIRVRISTTETPANTHEIEQIRGLVGDLGVGPENHFVRPLIQRGFSDEGLVLDRLTLVPELTVDRDGVYWHASATEDDLLVTEEIFPLRAAMDLIAIGFRDSGGEQQARPFR